MSASMKTILPQSLPLVRDYWLKAVASQQRNIVSFDPRLPKNIQVLRGPEGFFPASAYRYPYHLQINYKRDGKPEEQPPGKPPVLQPVPRFFRNFDRGQIVREGGNSVVIEGLGEEDFFFQLNKWPLAPLHFLMVLKSPFPQFLTASQLQSCVNILASNRTSEHVFFFNSNGAAASVNWVHWQWMLDRGPLPVFEATEKERIQGINAFTPYIPDWPARGLMFDTLFERDGNINSFALAKLYLWTTFLQVQNIPHNLVCYNGKLFFVPRKNEIAATDEAGLRFKFGALETAGEIIIRTIIDEDRTPLKTAEEIHREIEKNPLGWQEKITEAEESITFTAAELNRLITIFKETVGLLEDTEIEALFESSRDMGRFIGQINQALYPAEI